MGFLDAPRPLAFAHRGGAGDGVENALSAFADVQRLGYRYVETDVRTTSDGVAVVFHDDDTSRLTGTAGRIADLAMADVARLALAGGERVATLEQALTAFPGLRFNIDLKDEGSVRSVPRVLQRTGAGDRVCLTSFAERRVRAVRRRVGPEVCTGLGVGGVLALLAGRSCAPASVAQLPWSLPRGRTLPRWVVDAAHRRGLDVHVWTLDDPAAISAALDLGVDGVMTDRPGVLRDVLAARGQWHPAPGTT